MYQWSRRRLGRQFRRGGSSEPEPAEPARGSPAERDTVRIWLDAEKNRRLIKDMNVPHGHFRRYVPRYCTSNDTLKMYRRAGKFSVNYILRIWPKAVFLKIRILHTPCTSSFAHAHEIASPHQTFNSSRQPVLSLARETGQPLWCLYMVSCISAGQHAQLLTTPNYVSKSGIMISLS